VREAPGVGFTTSSGEGKMRGGLVEGGGLKWECSIRGRVLLAYTTKARFLHNYRRMHVVGGGGGAELKIPSSKQKNEQKARIEPAKSISDDCWSWLAMVFFLKKKKGNGRLAFFDPLPFFFTWTSLLK